ncbi:hypothetical protein DAH66_11415 [Sphingomonas koreensis]|uniref:Uncharacterized protein n=1 Tax=Sphingomonas koreensis TaxID=93064 RepID=A0A430G3A5_9SPHN|nr:hypothetical protein [Sphingomonas koreensis]RSY84679.1 hypothetical protein DAH66_11415 [Sphingomonas koreensis]
MIDIVPATLGLASNSDEFAVIEELEAEFGVTIDYADAPQWRTVGDLFTALLARLPAGLTNDPDVWERFVSTLSQTTDVDVETITPQMPLADEAQAWRGLNSLSWMLLFLAVGMALVVILGAVILIR